MNKQTIATILSAERGDIIKPEELQVFAAYWSPTFAVRHSDFDCVVSMPGHEIIEAEFTEWPPTEHDGTRSRKCEEVAS